MHRAGAALAVIATFLRAGECQALAQEIEERRARVDCDRSRMAIDDQRHDAFCVTVCGLVGNTCRPSVSHPLFRFMVVIIVPLIGEDCP